MFFCYIGINTKKLYSLYKNIVEGWNKGYLKATDLAKFKAAANAADMALRGKANEQMVKDGYQHYIDQNLIDTICEDLLKYTTADDPTYVTCSNTDAGSVQSISTTFSDWSDDGFGSRKCYNITVKVNPKYFDTSDLEFYIRNKETNTVATGVNRISSRTDGAYKYLTYAVPIKDFYSNIVISNFKETKRTVTLPATDPTGLTVSNKGTNTVWFNDDLTFTVEKKTGYTQGNPNADRAPVVKVDGTKITPVSTSGNKYTYTIKEIRTNKNVTVDALQPDIYNVTYSFAKNCGASMATGSATKITFGKTATVKIQLDSPNNRMTANDLLSYITVSNGAKLTDGKKSGSVITYTLSGATKDVGISVSKTLPLNKYTVTVPNGTGYTVNTNKLTVTHNQTGKFTLTLKPEYNRSNPIAKIDGKNIARTDKGNGVFEFETGSITADKAVTIEGITINKYKITLPTGEGYTVENADGFNNASITHGNEYQFVVKVNKAYNQHTPVVKLESEKKVSLVGNGFDGEGNAEYYFLVENVTDDDALLVENMSKNTYKAVLPSGTGYAAVATEGTDLNNIVYGTTLTFGVKLEEQYNRSKIVVKYNGEVLTPDEAGVYSIANITHNIGVREDDPKITVEGVELNNYYITLPLETETGFVIEVGEGLNAKAVKSGTDFKFKLFLDPAYSKSVPAIKYSSNGGKSYKALTAKNGNEYTIENVLSDCIVVVEGVSKNTYTVRFLDEDGVTLLDKPHTVKYGEGAEYQGTTPLKAPEKLSEKTDEATGITTVVNKEYEFSNWSADTTNVTSDLDVTPIFKVYEVTRKFKDGKEIGDPEFNLLSANILFVSDGVIVHRETVEKGEKFAGWDGIPVKKSSNPYETYEFLGWATGDDGVVDYAKGASTAIDKVTGDVTFVAAFKSNLPSQTVTFKTWNGKETIYTAIVKRGEKIVCPAYLIPEREDMVYSYKFAGWSYSEDQTEANVLDKISVGENDITVYAAYRKTPIVYTYEYVNYDGTVLKSGSYNYVTSKPEETIVKYDKEKPTRPQSKSNVYTFAGWERTNINGSRYAYRYTAIYKEAVREYNYKLPTPDGTFTVALDKSVGEKIPYGENLIFTVTVNEGYTAAAPVVKADKKVLEAEKSGNTYKYVIRADGENAEEIIRKLTDITVSTTVNEYLVKLTYVDENGDEKEVFNGLVKHGKSPSYVDPAKPADANGVYKLVGWDTNKDGKADITGRIENVKKAITGVAVFEYDHRHDGNPDDPDGVWELYPDLTKKADCTHAGSKTYGCKHCGITKVVAIPARGHNMTDWHIDKAPTCTETGRRSCYCQNTAETDEYKACGHRVSETIPAKGHTDSDGDYKCDDCGKDLGHCDKCVCHKGNVLSKVIRKVCTLLSKIFHTKIKCCKCMEWYGDEISSIS